MKKSLSIILGTLIFAACSSGNMGEKAETSEAKNIKESVSDATIFIANATFSKLEWVGSKPTGTHHGTVEIKSGELNVVNGDVVGGKFIFDMNTIENHDLEDEEWNQKLVGHLKSPDFFAVDSYPEAEFEITSISNFDGIIENADLLPTHVVGGNLTIKDITKNITFKANLKQEGDKIIAESLPFTINRADWDIKYKSKSFFDNLKDDFIDDQIGLKFKIETSKN